jgi:hypothetical protein
MKEKTDKMNFTKENAIAFSDARLWEPMTYRQRAEFQMGVKKLCMPFDVFHEAIEKALGRPVYTHEFGLNWKGLKDELFGEKGKPTLDEIIAMIPEEKRIVLVMDNRKEGKK